MFTELREWFSSVCECDGLNNLHEPRLDCMNSVTGNITSEVHHDNNNAAQTLIGLAKDNMQNRNQSVYLPSGWIVCLNPYCEWECDDSISGGGDYRAYSFKQQIILYIKNLTNCQNHNTVSYKLCMYVVYKL